MQIKYQVEQKLSNLDNHRGIKSLSASYYMQIMTRASLSQSRHILRSSDIAQNSDELKGCAHPKGHCDKQDEYDKDNQHHHQTGRLAGVAGKLSGQLALLLNSLQPSTHAG